MASSSTSSTSSTSTGHVEATGTFNNAIKCLSDPTVIKATCFTCGVILSCDRGVLVAPLTELFIGGIVGGAYAVGGNLVSRVLGKDARALIPITIGLATVAHVAREVKGQLSGQVTHVARDALSGQLRIFKTI